MIERLRFENGPMHGRELRATSEPQQPWEFHFPLVVNPALGIYATATYEISRLDDDGTTLVYRWLPQA